MFEKKMHIESIPSVIGLGESGGVRERERECSDGWREVFLPSGA